MTMKMQFLMKDILKNRDKNQLECDKFFPQITSYE